MSGVAITATVEALVVLQMLSIQFPLIHYNPNGVPTSGSINRAAEEVKNLEIPQSITAYMHENQVNEEIDKRALKALEEAKKARENIEKSENSYTKIFTYGGLNLAAVSSAVRYRKKSASNYYRSLEKTKEIKKKNCTV